MKPISTLLFTFLLSSTVLVAQSWLPIADYPTGIHHPVTFSLNGKGYSVTGTSASSIATKSFYEYDPVLDSWTTLTDFPGDARGYAIGLAYNGLGYLGFGSGSQLLNDFWSFNPQNNQWTQLTSCPCIARAHPALIALNNKIYMGLGSDGQNLRDWWEYDIITDSWTQMSDLPGPHRHHPYQFTAGGNVYAGLGHGNNGIYKDWYKLDTTTNTWSAMTDFPGEARVAGTQFDHAGNGYVMSGDGDNHSFMATGELWRYEHDLDTWTQLTPHPGVSRWAPGSFVIGNEVYFFGGVDKQANSFPISAYKFALPSTSTSVDDETQNRFSVYPLPFSSQLKLDAEFNGILHYRILSMNGEIFQNGTVMNGNINTDKLKNGMFILEIENAQGQSVARKRIVKLKE